MLVLFPFFSLLAIIITVTHFSSSFGEVSEQCLSVYEGGGISAVARSQQCSHLVRSFKNQTKNCQFASLKGQMDFNEQRIACNLNTVLPLAGKHGPEQVSIGVVALFDGIFGEEVSDAASNLLLEYLWAHSIFASYQGKLPGNDAKALHYLSNSTSGIFSLNPNESRHMRSIKEALLRAIYDIDSNFLKISMKERTFSMSMATVGVLLDSQLIVANIGDSNAILCSEKLDVHSGSTTPYLFVKELTEDREIEKERDSWC